MKLKLGFSTCPNDTFIFDAMVNGKIDTQGIDFEIVMADVEELNQLVLKGEMDVCKLSFHAFGYVQADYQLLTAGSALGFGCGPLLISAKPLDDFATNRGYVVAVPGKNTTAYFLFRLFYPEHNNLQTRVFHEIEPALLQGAAEAGVIIHENRFTYLEKGLHKIVDLGAAWEERTGFPIPLGGISVRRSLPSEVKSKVNEIMRQSVQYAFEHRDEVLPFVKKYAQEMEEAVMNQHIELYVNSYTRDLGVTGKEAISFFLNKGIDLGLFQSTEASPFVV